MTADADFPATVLLLYLLTFAAGAVGVVLPLLRGGKNMRTRRAGTFLQLLVITGILPSLQVLLDAMEISPNLPGAWSQNLNLGFNLCILMGIAATALGWSRMVRELFPGRLSWERVSRVVRPVLGSVLVFAAVGQMMALTRPGTFTLVFASRSLELFLLLLALVVIDGAAGCFRPAEPTMNPRTIWLTRSLVPLSIAWTLLYLLLPDTIAMYIPPAGLLSLYACTAALFLKLPHTASGESRDPAVRLSEAGLTARETEIALLLARGNSYREIAGKLFVSLSTVQTHVGRIYSKMDVSNKTELSRKVGEDDPGIA